MRRLFSFIAPLLLGLALPALAQAHTGTVLSVSQPKHQVQLVGTHDVVQAYTFRGHLNGVQRGTKLSFAAAGSRITRAKALGTASRFSFLGKVVHSGNGALVLALADSHHLSLPTKSSTAHRAARSRVRAHCDSGSSSSTPTVTINFNGLASGQTVLVTESTDSSGDVTITISVPPGNDSQFGPEETATGVVGHVGTSWFDLITSDRSDLKLHMAAGALANLKLSPCDAVVVSYHVDDQMLIADNVADAGPSDTGACATGGSGGDQGGPGTGDANLIGTITAVSSTSITIDASSYGGGTQAFTVENPSVTHGFIVGDTVEVTYQLDGSAFVADEVSYYNTLTSGVVTALAQAGAGFDTITITDDHGGQSETFYVSTSLLQGQGALVGDDISVAYYQAARGLTLDYLHDNGPAS